MRLTLIVLRCGDIARSVAFYRALGLTPVREQHGAGPEHFSCELEDGVVLELYPRAGRETSGLRIGFRVPDVARAIAAGQALGCAVNGAVVTDPDGHQVALT